MRPQPLPSLILQCRSVSEALLTIEMASELRSLLPQRLQLKHTWQCIYNLDQHGIALSTLYNNCSLLAKKDDDRLGYVMIVKDEHGSIFGGYMNQAPQIRSVHYGNGECFLFKIEDLPHGFRFKAFPWTGLNDYQIFCTQDFISIGGGDGKHGLWLDDKLEYGLSSSTMTFGNEPLCENVEPGARFRVVSVEVWVI